MEAVSRKVVVSPDVDWNIVAEATSGLSGADLQALVYNAHLEVVHESIATINLGEKMTTKLDADEPVRYVRFGAAKQSKVLSRADESALVQRV